MSSSGIDMLFARIQELEETLRDLSRGADMVLPYFDGAALSYIKEVKRASQAALAIRTPDPEPFALPNRVIDEAFVRIMGAPR